MEKNNKKPELDMFTVLNPEFHGMTESQFGHKENKESNSRPQTSDIENNEQ